MYAHHASRSVRSLLFVPALLIGTAACDDGDPFTAPGPVVSPAPTMGSLTVTTNVFGAGPDGADFLSLVTVETGGTSNPEPQLVSAVDSAFFPDLLPGTYVIQVESQVADCTVDGPNSRSTSVFANLPTSEHFAALCPKSAATEIFKRLSELEWDGRFFLEDDGTFTLDYGSRFLNGVGYPGTYSVQGDDYAFVFTTDALTGLWEATATRTDNCLAVDFNAQMDFEDFQDGLYCRRS